MIKIVGVRFRKAGKIYYFDPAGMEIETGTHVIVETARGIEFFVVGRIARGLAFSVMRPDDRPQFITYAISICICCIMCPVMSLIATILFKENQSFGTCFPIEMI